MVNDYQKNILITEQFNKLANKLSALITFNQNIDIRKLEDSILKTLNMSNYFKLSITDNLDLIELNNATDKIVSSYEFKDYKKMQDFINNKKSSAFTKDGPLLEVNIITCMDQCYLLTSFHHVAYDGISMNLLLDVLLKNYHRYCIGEPLVKIDRIDEELLDQEKKYKNLKSFKRDEEFWNLKQGLEYKIRSIFDNKINDFSGKRIEKILNQEYTKKIKKFCINHKVSEASFFMTCLMLTVKPYFDTSKICIGTAIHNRNNKQLTKLCMTTNTVPLICDMKFEGNIIEWNKKVFGDLLEVYHHGRYTRSDLSKMYKILFSYQVNKFECKDVDFNCEWLYSDNASIPLTFSVADFSKLGKNKIYLDYNRSIISDKFAELIIDRYVSICKDVLDDVERIIGKGSYITIQEKEGIKKVNDTKVNIVNDKTILDLFHENVLKKPYKLALIYEDKSCTYKELDYYSNKVAELLVANGVKPCDKVGIIFEKSLEMVYSIWGVIKSGACYIPIDRMWPESRTKQVIDSSKCRVLLVSNNVSVNDYDIKILRFDESINFSGNFTKYQLTRNMLSYIIYTSGSTGKPKGVMVSNDNVMNLVFDSIMNITEEDIFLQLINYTFDVSIMGYLVALIKGATTIIASDEVVLDPYLTANMVYDNKVTVLNTTTALFREWIPYIDKFKNMRRIMTGGEKLSLDVVNQVMPTLDEILVNGYGPTETTVYSTAKIITKDVKNNVSIGKPILNTEVFVFDNNMEMTAVMECGQLYIAGNGVCNGYVDKVENKRFVSNPFGEGLMYATGDICYFTPDYELNYVDRIDTQIKINGYRIETSEIEGEINKIEGINSSIVIAENNSLIAYLESDLEISKSYIINKLVDKLPSYMIPNNYYIVSKVPLTSNGKIDYNKLKSFVVKKLNIDSLIQEVSKEEETIKKIFAKILNNDDIGTNISFFALGGNSIQAIKLVATIKKELNINLLVSDFYEHSTICDLAKFLKNAKITDNNRIKKAEKKDKYQLAPSQEMIFSIWNMDKQSLKYNIPVIIKLNDEININKIEECINKLILKNESMRTRISLVDNLPYQVIDEYTYKKNVVMKINGKIQDYSMLYKPFDLFKDHPFRSMIVEDDFDRYLFFEFHHYMFDGAAIEIILDDLSKLYNGKYTTIDTKELIQNKDYSEYLLSLPKEKSEEFWKNKLLDVKSANIKEHLIRDIDNIDETGLFRYTFSKKLSNDIRDKAVKNSCSLHNYMLTVFSILLSKYNDEGNISIGTILSGRIEDEFDQVASMMVNSIPVAFNIKKDQSVRAVLNNMLSFMGQAYDNSTIGFNNIVKVVKPRREINRNTLFDIMFVMQDTNFKTELGKTIKDDSMLIDEKFDLTVEIQVDEEITLNITYKKNLYDSLEIELMAKRYEMILSQVNSNIECTVDEVNILTELDKALIIQFNSNNKDYPKQLSVSDVFYQKAKQYPLNTAVRMGNRKINYRKLLKRASEIASYLNKNHIRKGDIVGLYCVRSIEMIEAILGVILSGAAYLPIDIKTPKYRIQHMINECEVNSVIVYNCDETKLPNMVNIIDINNIESNGVFSKRIEPQNSPDDLLYIMYTSGSTGKPKGVSIKHSNVVELICAGEKFERYLNISNYAFDGSVYDIFGAILNGGSVTMLDEVQAMDPVSIAKIVKENNIQSFFIPSALFNTFSEEEFKNMTLVSRMYVGGEKLLEAHIKKALKYIKNGIYNGYGPTEATVFSASCNIKAVDRGYIPIGKPFNNTKIYIMDDKNRLCPVGISGNLNISGPGLSDGYIKNEKYTAERFRTDLVENQRLYISGDIGRFDVDGSVEYLGRKDNQVKFRGFRIELNEIKNALLEINNIIEAEVLVKEHNGNKELYAFYVTKDNKEISDLDINRMLKDSLPDYMIPRFFEKIEKMPLTINGKIDKKELLSIEVSNTHQGEYFEPKTNVEKLIACKWQELFNIDKVSVDDDFFELGGHSIQAIKFISEMKEHGIELTVKDVINNSKMYKLAEMIEKNTQKQVEDAYRRKMIFSIEKQGKFHKIKNGGKNVIFIFPTYMLNIAYEVTFTRMVENFDGWTCYLGNFTDSKDYINQYLKDVLRYSRNADKVIFIGYSFGGCLAYEVAKLAERKGVNIDNLIILDSFFKKKADNGFDSFSDGIKDIKQLRSFLEERFAFYRDLEESIKQSIENCFLSFFEHTRNLVNTKEIIKTPISYLWAENQEFDVEDTREIWREGCTQEYHQYDGFGKHNDMLDQEHINKNIEIITKLL